jgi:hypothetical protein
LDPTHKEEEEEEVGADGERSPRKQKTDASDGGYDAEAGWLSGSVNAVGYEFKMLGAEIGEAMQTLNPLVAPEPKKSVIGIRPEHNEVRRCNNVRQQAISLHSRDSHEPSFYSEKPTHKLHCVLCCVYACVCVCVGAASPTLGLRVPPRGRVSKSSAWWGQGPSRLGACYSRERVSGLQVQSLQLVADREI